MCFVIVFYYQGLLKNIQCTKSLMFQDFREFMKENRLAPASPAVAEIATVLPIQKGQGESLNLKKDSFTS